MKLILLLLLLPLAALAQPSPGSFPRPIPGPTQPQLQWGSNPRVAPLVSAGWVLGTDAGKCLAISPNNQRFVFAPRGDGKCYIEDIR